MSGNGDPVLERSVQIVNRLGLHARPAAEFVKLAGRFRAEIKVEKDGRVIGGTPPFPAGESRSASVRLASGTYEFICTVGDHAELGMKGTLKVD